MSHSLAAKSLSTLAIAVSVAWLPGMASAQPPQRVDQRDLVACRAASATQSEADCLYEARSVRRDATAGKAPPPVSAQVLAANALSRCQVQPVNEREACVRMVQGMGTREGSVAEGGLVTEIVTRTVGPVPAVYPL
jgi:hypothetical protein